MITRHPFAPPRQQVFPPTPPSAPAVPAGRLHEVRLYGLDSGVTSDHLVDFLSTGVRVLGVLLHPFSTDTQWAQVWVGSETEVESCLTLREHLASKGITVSRPPSTSSPFPALPPFSTPQTLSPPQSAPTSPPSTALGMSFPAIVPHPITPQWHGVSSREMGMPPRVADPHGHLPRNLYIVNIPVDLSQ